MDEVEKNLLPTLANSLLEVKSDLKDIGLELLESPIDNLIENDLIKEIPIVKTVASVVKVGLNLKERQLLRNTLLFIQKFNNNNYIYLDLENHINGLLGKPKELEKELGRVLLLLDRSIDSEKSYILANFYKSYIMKKISWDKFCEFTYILDAMFIGDVCALKKAGVAKEPYYGDISEERLLGYGLLSDKQAITVDDLGTGNKKVAISDLGKEFIKYGVSF